MPRRKSLVTVIGAMVREQVQDAVQGLLGAVGARRGRLRTGADGGGSGGDREDRPGRRRECAVGRGNHGSRSSSVSRLRRRLRERGTLPDLPPSLRAERASPDRLWGFVADRDETRRPRPIRHRVRAADPPPWRSLRGLPFLILDGQFARRSRPLVIGGPPGVRQRVEAAMEVFFRARPGWTAASPSSLSSFESGCRASSDPPP